MNRYPLEIFWSAEDAGFIAEAPDLPGCSALLLDVIPDGAQRRAGIQTGTPQGPMDDQLRCW